MPKLKTAHLDNRTRGRAPIVADLHRDKERLQSCESTQEENAVIEHLLASNNLDTLLDKMAQLLNWQAEATKNRGVRQAIRDEAKALLRLADDITEGNIYRK
jgi:hypothetical protein